MTADLTSVRDRYDVAARVERGVAWLDEHDPGWWKDDQPGYGPAGRPIDLDELAMESTDSCVLGQRWGSYMLAPLKSPATVALGFDIDVMTTPARETGAELDALGAEWSTVIRARRSAVANA